MVLTSCDDAMGAGCAAVVIMSRANEYHFTAELVQRWFGSLSER